MKAGSGNAAELRPHGMNETDEETSVERESPGPHKERRSVQSDSRLNPPQRPFALVVERPGAALFLESPDAESHRDRSCPRPVASENPGLRTVERP